MFGNINDNSIGFGVGKDGKGYDEKYKYFNRNQLKYPKKPNSFLVKEKKNDNESSELYGDLTNLSKQETMIMEN